MNRVPSENEADRCNKLLSSGLGIDRNTCYEVGQLPRHVDAVGSGIGAGL